MSFTLCLETLRNCSTALEKCANDMSIINSNIPCQSLSSPDANTPPSPGWSWLILVLLLAIIGGRYRIFS